VRQRSIARNTTYCCGLSTQLSSSAALEARAMSPTSTRGPEADVLRLHAAVSGTAR
jgi:hypothetical protein